MPRPTLLRRALRAGRRQLVSLWFARVADRLFALREWLAEAPNRLARKNRPVLDILRLESRQMPVTNLSIVGDMFLNLVDDYEYANLAVANLAWQGSGTPSIYIDWGDETTVDVATIGPVTESPPGSGSFSAVAFGTHDYDLVGEYTISLTGDGGATGADAVLVDEGQYIGFDHDTQVVESAGNYVVTVLLSQESTTPSRPVTVYYSTRDGQFEVDKARAGATLDYIATSGTATIAAGTRSTTFTVPIRDDSVDDRDNLERFHVDFSNPTQALFGLAAPTDSIQLHIQDNDEAAVRFARDLYTFGETVGTAQVPVTLSHESEKTVQVAYTTKGAFSPYASSPQATPVAAGGTPTGSSDYETTTGTLTFDPGVRSRTIDIPVFDNTLSDSAYEYFGVELSNAQNARLGNPVAPARTQANVRIIDKSVLQALQALGLVAGHFGPAGAFYVLGGFFGGLPFFYNLNGAAGVEVDLLGADVQYVVSNQVCATGPYCIREVSAGPPVELTLDGVARGGSNASDMRNAVPRTDTGLRYSGASTSDHRPTVGVELQTDASGLVPTSFDVTLTFGGVTGSPVSFSNSGHAAGDSYVFAVQPSSAPTTSGVVEWSADVTAHYSGGASMTRTVEGTTGVVVRGTANPYGNGWNIDGLDRVYAGADYALYAGGDGRLRVFTNETDFDYTNPPGEFGTFEKNGDGTFTYTTPEQTRKHFDTAGRMTTVVDRHGLTSTYAYDGQGRLSTLVDYDGRRATFVYDATSAKLLRIEQMGGRTTTYSYTGSDLTAVTHPDGGLHTFTYDAYHRLSGEQYGPLRTTFTYEASNGFLTSIDQGLGTVTTFAQLLRRSLVPQAQFSLATVTDALSQTTTFLLDPGGRPSFQWGPDSTLRSWGWDFAGRLTRATDPLGRATTFAYATGTADLTGVTHPDGAAEAFQYDPTYHLPTRYTDALGQVTTITRNAVGDAVTVKDPLNRTTTLAWSAATGEAGLLKSVTDAANHTTTFQYSTNRRLEAVVHPDNTRTSYGYDAAWNLTTVTDELGRVTTTLYDPMRRLVQVVTPDSASTTFAYNAPGWRTGGTDVMGTRAAYDYDMQGRLTGVTEALGTSLQRTTTFAYDKVGQLTGQTDPLGRTASFAYDAGGRLTRAVGAYGLPEQATATYAYDLAGQLRSAADPLGRVTSFAYDRRGRAVQATDPLGRAAAAQYDAAGRLVRTAAPRDLAALGEFEPHTTTSSDQHYPAVAAAADGSFVAVWQSQNNDGEGWGIFGQRYSAAGVRIGNEFQVNTHYQDDQTAPAIAMAPGGAFVVVWQSADQDGSDTGIYAKRYNAAGVAQSTLDLPVNTTTFSYQLHPAVSAGADGRFVVAWMSYLQDSSGYGIYTQRFSATGVAEGNETRVNTTLSDHQWYPTVAVGQDGAYLVAWQGENQDGNAAGIFARWYSDAGQAVGGEFQVNTSYVANQMVPASAAVAADGSFVIGWQSNAGGNYDVVVRAYSAARVALTAEVVANTTQSDYQGNVAVAVAPGGSFLAVWESAGQDGSGSGVYGQRFSPGGAKWGPEFRVNSFTDGSQWAAKAAADGLGNFVAVWMSAGHDGSGLGVVGQRLSGATVTSIAYDPAGQATGVTEAYGLPEQRTSTVAYDAAGNVRSLTDARNTVTSFAYDVRDRVTHAVEAYGTALARTTQLWYRADGRVSQVRDAAGVDTYQFYDLAGRPTDTVEAYGRPEERTTDLWFRADGRLGWVRDARGMDLALSYDALGRLSAAVEGWGTGLERTTAYEYDAADNLKAVVDPLARRTTAVYDALNRVVETIDALGQRATVVYDAAGQVLRTIDPRNVITSFAYDLGGRATKVVEAFGRPEQATTTIAYDLAGNVLWSIDPRGTTTSVAYDALGRATKVVEAFGTALARATMLTYDAGDNLLTAVNARNVTSSFAYDALGQVTRVTEAVGLPEQRLTVTAYDAVGRLLSVTDPRNVTTSFGYDGLGRATRIVEAFGDALQRTTTVAYDATDNVTAVTTPRGFTTTLTYDILGRQTEVRDALGGLTTTVYDAGDRVLAVADPLNHRTTFGYDALDRVKTVTDALNKTTTLAYDETGNVLSVTNARGHATAFAYDGLARLTQVTDALTKVTTYEYDAGGLLTTMVNARGHHGTLAYDVLGRLTAQTDPLGHTTAFGYDANDNLTRVTDALNKTTTLAYDNLDRQVSAQSPAGGVATTVYDAADNVLAAIDALGKRTTFSYDALSRQTQIQDPRNGLTTLAYDGNDNLTSLIDPVGNRTTFVYDALDRRERMTDPRNKSVTYAYDAASRLTSRTDRLGRRIDFAYDDADQLTGQTWYATGGAVAQRVTYAYDPVGNQTLAANGAGTYTLTYDAVDRVAAVQEPFNLALTFAYDAVGNRTTVEDSKGGLATSVYDAANRLTSRQFTGNSATLRFDYTYTARDQVENVKRYSDLAGTTQVGLTSIAYDPAGRTEVVKHRDGSSNWFQTTTYSYDLADRMTVENRNGTPVTYTYDATDQLTGDGANTYGYDLAGNRNTTGYTTDTGNRPTADGTYTYQYDDEGNRTRKTANSDGSYWTYEYDHANQMTAARKYTSAGVLTAEVTYKYDAWGNRVERVEDPDGAGAQGTTTERYGLDGWKIQQDFWGNTAGFAGNENFDAWADLDGSNVLLTRRLYGDGVDEPIARVSAAGATAWYHQDVRGSVTALTDATGTVQTQYAYDGFGNATLTGSAAFGDRYLYTARELDAATGLQYTRARWYDPRTGTFTTEDSWGFAAGDANLYRYVGNQATNATDPSGNFLILNVASHRDGYLRELMQRLTRMGLRVNFTYLGGGRFGVVAADTDRVRQLLAALPEGDDMRPILAALASTGGRYNVIDSRTHMAETGLTPHELSELVKFQSRMWFPDNYRYVPDARASLFRAWCSGFQTGLKGTGNAAATTLRTTVTLGFIDDEWRVIDVTAEDIEAGYEKSLGFQRFGFEILVAVAAGKLSYRTGNVGKVVFTWDVGQNGVSTSKGVFSLITEGWNREGVVQVVTGLFGLAGNYLGRVSCFPPDTPVATESGPRPIGQIEAGERVWGYDIGRGEWRLCEVERRHDNVYDGQFVTLHTDAGSVTATARHPFWVVEGAGLEQRTLCREVPANEDRGGALAGRWVDSHDVREGDMVFLRGRGRAVVRRVDLRPGRRPVCNLTVAGLHTFAVGEAQLLVHNTSGSPNPGAPKRPIITNSRAVTPEDLAANVRGLTDPAAKTQAIRDFLEAFKAQRVAAGKAWDFQIGLTRNGDAVFYGPAGRMASPVGPGGQINRNVVMVTKDGRLYHLTLEGLTIVNPTPKYPIIDVDLDKCRAVEIPH